jgi:hypothetical protein
MSIKYAYVLTSQVQGPPKFTQMGIFWFKNTYTIWQPLVTSLLLARKHLSKDFFGFALSKWETNKIRPKKVEPPEQRMPTS